MSGCHDNNNFGVGGSFAFIVVLFILLIIVGASFCGGWGGGYGAAPVQGYGGFCC